MPRNHDEVVSRLEQHIADLQERLKAERVRSKGRAALKRFAVDHGLTATDLRMVAKSLDEGRYVADEPVESKVGKGTRQGQRKGGQQGKGLQPAVGKIGK